MPSNFIRGYDPRTGKELWKIGGSSKITAPTPVLRRGHVRRREWTRTGAADLRRASAGARGDLTLPDGVAKSEAVAWSRTGPWVVHAHATNLQRLALRAGQQRCLRRVQLATGEEVYRQRLPQVGNGFSASPVAADGKIYISSEDGDMLVIAAGAGFKHVATNSMGEPLMATPAFSDGVMYVRSATTLSAIGHKP